MTDLPTMDVYTAIRTRRDIERFSEERPPREVVERLIEAAVWAPNHKLTEPWRFHVLAGRGREAMADAVAAWLAAEGKPEGAQRSARSKLLRAPVILIVTQAGTPDDSVRDLEDYAACAIAVHNILLAAHAEGLVAHLSTDAMAQYEEAKRYLGLAPHDRIVAYVNLGYPRPDDPPKAGQRSAPVVRWDWS
jgi:nitroreductase